MRSWGSKHRFWRDCLYWQTSKSFWNTDYYLRRWIKLNLMSNIILIKTKVLATGGKVPNSRHSNLQMKRIVWSNLIKSYLSYSKLVLLNKFIKKQSLKLTNRTQELYFVIKISSLFVYQEVLFWPLQKFNENSFFEQIYQERISRTDQYRSQRMYFIITI